MTFIGLDRKRYHTYVGATSERAARKMLLDRPPQPGVLSIESAEAIDQPLEFRPVPWTPKTRPASAPPPPPSRPPAPLTAEEEFDRRYLRDVGDAERGGRRGRSPMLYEDLVALGIPLDHHESDLYVLDVPEARDVIRRHGRRFTPFQSKREGLTWLEVPFAFDPWWDARR